MTDYSSNPEFVLWCGKKKEEFKDVDIKNELCAAAILENKSSYLEILLSLQYPENGTGVDYCIINNFGECLKVLIKHLDFKVDKLEELRDIAQNKTSIKCISYLQDRIDEINSGECKDEITRNTYKYFDALIRFDHVMNVTVTHNCTAYDKDKCNIIMLKKISATHNAYSIYMKKVRDMLAFDCIEARTEARIEASIEARN